MITVTSPGSHSSPRGSLIGPKYVQSVRQSTTFRSPNCGQNAHRTMIPIMDRPWALSSVMWPSCDNPATMHHEGCLVGHPPGWNTWVLGVPTLVSCYSCPICITDAPFRALGPVDLGCLSFPNWGSVVCTLVS